MMRNFSIIAMLIGLMESPPLLFAELLTETVQLLQELVLALLPTSGK
ncbi:hypothetical protein [Chitinophaga qingshengii]|uniref:Uncharacterized protein n=1 Tax=Chitinophaga qingshengii TaxID=1569794 RepID=A0ABR7TNQ3_9BACT|nr:hypothetical protein [Chitinophaga qingshengii]MBC9932105.1 hypothetical protein [Chitinophaga qingshengii]